MTLNPRRKPAAFAFALLAATLTLSSCGGPLNFSSYPNAGVALSPHVPSIAINGTQTFTATATNDPLTPSISFGYGYGSTNLGTLTASGSSSTYTAPPTPPIYPGLIPPSEQGTVTVYASETNGLLSSVTASETFAITAPAVTAGINPASVSVGRGTYVQLSGYAVGNVNNNVTWQVNGVTGGNTSLGTISPLGLYTAPTELPMAGPTVTVTLISVADPTKTATCTVTIT